VLVAVALVVVAVANWGDTPLTLRNIEQVLVFALPLAGIYALAATGLVVVYSTTGVFNFSQGAIGMLAAFTYWQLKVAWGWSTWISVVLTVFVFAPLFGIVLERLIMRHLAGRDLVVQLMVTVGLFLGFIGVANTIWNPNDGHSVPPFFAGTASTGSGVFQSDGIHIVGVVLTWHRFTYVVVAVALVIALRFLLYSTRTGIAMRAVVDNRGLASLNGVSTARVSMFAWALGTTLAALAGVLYATETDMSAGGTLVLATLVPAFAAAAVGRMRSLPLAYLGAFILAFAQQFTAEFLSFGSRWAQVPVEIPEIMLFIVLLLLPAANLRFARISKVRRHARVTRPRSGAFGLLVLAFALPGLGLLLSATNLSRLDEGIGLALVALSLVPLTGWAGQVSFAPLAFAGIGAAAFAQLGGDQGHWWAIFVAAAVTAPVGAAISLIAGRLQGLYLGLATFAFAYFTRDVILNQPFAFGGQSLTTPRPTWFGISFVGNEAYLVLLSVVFAILAFLMILLRNGAWGRRLVALRDSEAASATVGVNLFETKVAVFTVSAAIAGLGGAFLAMFYVHTSASQFEALAGLGLVLQMVVGGITLVTGAVFAGVFQLPIQIIQEKWNFAILRGLQQIAPGFAALAIIQNPDGAVVATADGTYDGINRVRKLLRKPPIPGHEKPPKPKRRTVRDLKIEDAVPQLGITEPFTPTTVAEIDAQLGVGRELAELTGAP
jgi:branched-chain amino acid transport system permease protein